MESRGFHQLHFCAALRSLPLSKTLPYSHHTAHTLAAGASCQPIWGSCCRMPEGGGREYAQSLLSPLLACAPAAPALLTTPWLTPQGTWGGHHTKAEKGSMVPACLSYATHLSTILHTPKGLHCN